MILRRVKLDNIRSYLSEEVVFPNGTILLSGDIGSGKSTILLAVDFALFGIQKNLSGASLLRHGKEEGSVELDFVLGDNEYSIKRTLKRKNNAVRQASAHIISNSVKKDLTAQEAKFFILELLGYPAQALRKDSALIYRYTVYTPQEQMRHIIDADSGERLDLIRRLFGIDKYKRIAENAEVYAKELRGQARELSGMIVDLDEKKNEKKELLNQAETYLKSHKEILEKLSGQEKIVLEKKQELESIQAKLETIQKKKQEYASLKTEFEMLKVDVEKVKVSFAEIDPKLTLLDEKLDKFKDITKPQLTLDGINSKISQLETKQKAIVSNSGALENEVKSLQEILEKGTCGTCKQTVADREAFKTGIDEKKKLIEKYAKEDKDIRNEIENLKKELGAATKYDSLIREKTTLSERKEEFLDLESRYKLEFESKQTKLKGLAEKANTLARAIKDDKLLERFKGKQKEYENQRKIREEIQREDSVIRQKIADLNKNVDSLSGEIKKKEELKSKMELCKLYDSWIRDFFVKLMGTIERHVMVNVQHEFNSLFQKWFSMLVMDEGLNARVDENFSVLIEQDGFETEYSFMSGGERTAIALAYRLALNRVINDLIEKIRTKDLMILDEPTDGFSTDQMSSVRDVLSELGNKQTLIVSHETEIESFVDQTIRFVKENNVSHVA